MNNNKEIEKLSHSEISNILIKARVQSRWKNAFEKIKNKQFLFNEENKKFLSMAYTRNLTTKVKPSLEQNSIAQKFTAMLKKKFKFLSIKQYKMINDICYADVEEHIKKRQKLKKALMMNYMGNSDKKARINIKKQTTIRKQIMHNAIGRNEHKRLNIFLKPFKKYVKVYRPDGLFRVSFDILAMIFIVWELMQIPLLLSFQDIDLESSGFDTFSTFITTFFLTDVLLNFNTAFYERGIIITRRWEIIKHYIKTWFIIDLISSFPYDIVVDSIIIATMDEDDSSNAKSLSQSTKLLRILQFIKFVRVLRLLRALKLKRIFGKLEDYLQLSPTINAIIALIRLSFMIICIAHWCACGFHMVAVFEDTDYSNNWIRQLGLENEDWATRYITSIYWALTTMTTIGYGDISPTTNPEKIFAMFMMLLSSGIFGYTMNRIGNILQSFNEMSTEYKMKIFQINQYMIRKNVPKELQARIRKYIEYTLDPEKNNQIDEKILFQTISKNLQEEIIVCINGNIIKQYEFLYKIFSPDLLFKTSFCIHENIYGPEEIIVQEEILEDNPGIYFLTSGVVTVFSQNCNSIFYVLKEGSYFGEISFFSNFIRTASVKSSDFISIYKLTRNDFLDIIEKENLLEDREIFCQMKDKLELYKDSFLLNLVCYSCNLSGHVAKFCPEVHYIPNREEIVKIKQKSNFKEMKNFKRFKRQKFKNLAKLSLVQTSAHAIRNTMFMYHEEGVKENCRFDMDMNDFLEENQKGMENLFEKMIPINKLNSFQLIINKKISKNDSDEKIVSNILNEEKSEPNRMDQINILKNWEIWNKFEEIRIFTKYFIHNNFSIIKKKLNNEKNKIKLASKRQSLQHRVHMIKNKTIKQIKNDLFASSLINEKSIENIQENRSHKILVSIDSIKECEKLIEKYGVENVYSIAKQKYKSLKSLE